MRALGVLAAASVVLLLAGCASGPSMPARPSEAAAREASRQQLIQAWPALQLSQEQSMPGLPDVPLVPLAKWATTMNACLATTPARGIIIYGSYGRDASRLDADNLGYDDEQIADFTCRAENPIDPRDVYLTSRAQNDYLYRYFVDWLTPCLTLQGHRVKEPPTLAEFRDNPTWSPYAALSDIRSLASSRSLTRLRALIAACPAAPAGFPFDKIDLLGSYRTS